MGFDFDGLQLPAWLGAALTPMAAGLLTGIGRILLDEVEGTLRQQTQQTASGEQPFTACAAGQLGVQAVVGLGWLAAALASALGASAAAPGTPAADQLQHLLQRCARLICHDAEGGSGSASNAGRVAPMQQLARNLHTMAAAHVLAACLTVLDAGHASKLLQTAPGLLAATARLTLGSPPVGCGVTLRMWSTFAFVLNECKWRLARLLVLAGPSAQLESLLDGALEALRYASLPSMRSILHCVEGVLDMSSATDARTMLPSIIALVSLISTAVDSLWKIHATELLLVSPTPVSMQM